MKLSRGVAEMIVKNNPLEPTIKGLRNNGLFPNTKRSLGTEDHLDVVMSFFSEVLPFYFLLTAAEIAFFAMMVLFIPAFLLDLLVVLFNAIIKFFKALGWIIEELDKLFTKK